MLYVMAPSARKIPVLSSKRRVTTGGSNGIQFTSARAEEDSAQEPRTPAPIVMFRPRREPQAFDVPPLR